MQGCPRAPKIPCLVVGSFPERRFKLLGKGMAGSEVGYFFVFATVGKLPTHLAHLSHNGIFS